VTETATLLRREVEKAGAISFARFMELALYCPDFGYYERQNQRVGRRGDFYTSVSTGSLFGELLTFQFARWLGDCDSTSFQLVEAGAHDGQLALDVLGWLQRQRPDILARLEYWLVEPSSARQTWQRGKLEQFAGRVHWADSLQGLPEDGVCGVIFSNELLDAFPVHRLSWDHSTKQWFEWGVGLSGNDNFVWTRLPDIRCDWDIALENAGFEFSAELKAILPDGFTIELCPTAAAWWQHAATILKCGRLMTIDYGLSAQEFLSPERSHGTLRAYHQHHLSTDVLAAPGEQDITAHVNFTQLERAGRLAGLKTDGLSTQSKFLTEIAKEIWTAGVVTPSPSQARRFQTLIHPEHLGGSFRVLVQSRGG